MIEAVQKKTFLELEKNFEGDILKKKKAEYQAIYEEQKKTLNQCLLKDDKNISKDITVDLDVLTKPIHPIVIGILAAYSSATNLYSELNKALRDMIVEYQD